MHDHYHGAPPLILVGQEAGHQRRPLRRHPHLVARTPRRRLRPPAGGQAAAQQLPLLLAQDHERQPDQPASARRHVCSPPTPPLVMQGAVEWL